MNRLRDLLRPAVSAFRPVAVAEAFSWALLLVAMFLKYVTESEPFGIPEGGVPVAGAIHGAVFVLYVAVTASTALVQRWSRGTTLLALAASIPPLLTWWFERSATRRGLLDAPVTTPAGSPAS